MFIQSKDIQKTDDFFLDILTFSRSDRFDIKIRIVTNDD